MTCIRPLIYANFRYDCGVSSSDSLCPHEERQSDQHPPKRNGDASGQMDLELPEENQLTLTQGMKNSILKLIEYMDQNKLMKIQLSLYYYFNLCK
jgi:hypothetical protein